MNGLVVDTSVWIDFFQGNAVPSLDEALAGGFAVLPPVVAAELISGTTSKRDRDRIAELLANLPFHECPLEHWIRVGDLRRAMKTRGIAISTPDAHVAQCALDRNSILLTRDAVFQMIAPHCGLRFRRD